MKNDASVEWVSKCDTCYKTDVGDPPIGMLLFSFALFFAFHVARAVHALS